MYYKPRSVNFHQHRPIHCSLKGSWLSHSMRSQWAILLDCPPLSPDSPLSPLTLMKLLWYRDLYRSMYYEKSILWPQISICSLCYSVLSYSLHKVYTLDHRSFRQQAIKCYSVLTIRSFIYAYLSYTAIFLINLMLAFKKIYSNDQQET